MKTDSAVQVDPQFDVSTTLAQSRSLPPRTDDRKIIMRYEDNQSAPDYSTWLDPPQLARLLMAARAAQQVGRGAALAQNGALVALPGSAGAGPQPTGQPSMPTQTPLSVLGPTSPFAMGSGAASQFGTAGRPTSDPPTNPDPAKATAILSLRQSQANPPASTVGYNQGLKERSYAPEGVRGHEVMDSTLVQGEAYNLFKDAMYGNDRTERSMWVVSKDGKYSFVRWPWSAEANKEVWKGPPPADTVAVVHTHPTASAETPSDKDRDLARGKQSKKIRMPLYVLHRNGIWKADPA